MLYETLRQGVVFFAMIYFGLVGGIVYELKNLLQEPLKKPKILVFFLDVIFYIFLAGLFLIAVNVVNYGEIRLFVLLSFLIGLILERITIGTIVANLFKFLYNKSVKPLKDTVVAKIQSFKRGKTK